jgi:CRP/FNR family cyclic AMP-dependent transcriptional regulator
MMLDRPPVDRLPGTGAGRGGRSRDTDSVDDIEGTAGIMLVERETLVQRIPSILDHLADDDRQRLTAIGQQRAFEPEEPLFRQGDPHKGIYLINSGRIRSYYAAPSGREVTLAYWFPGNFVGAPEMFGGGTHMWGSSAVQRSTATFLPGPALRELALQSATIAVALIDALSFKARCYSAMAQMLGTRSATERLERLLVFLATVYGLKEEGGIVIAASFTHADFANLIGSTRQWVTVQLARLQERGIIRYNRGLLVIHDPASLGLSDRG